MKSREAKRSEAWQLIAWVCGGVIMLLVVVAAQEWPMWDQATVLVAQTLVLAITAGILLWYTWETRQLRKVQQWPLVIVQHLEMNHVILANVGNSPALNIRVEGYRLELVDAARQAYEDGRSLRSSNVLLHLAPRGSAKVRLEPYRQELAPGSVTDTVQLEAHLLSEPHPILTLRLYFQNVAMEPFFAEAMIHTGSIKLVQSVKMWGLFGVPIFRLYHPENRDLLTIKHTPLGQLGYVQLTQRGRCLQSKPLRP